LRDEDFSCNFDVLYKGLRINKMQFFIKINVKNFVSNNFCSIFGHQNFGSRSASASESALSKNAEPVFLNVYGAQESIPRNEYR
jgi:hypothetical protein